MKLLTLYLASRLPCHGLYYDWTREHVIPKSLRLPVVEDPRNIVPLPAKLNHARASKPYSEDFMDGYLVYACSNCPAPHFCSGAAIVTPNGINPPNAFKGVIGRSVLHSAFKYPRYAETIDENVLKLDTAIKWDRLYPMTPEEEEWIRSL